MKIKKIEITNITSLKGFHEIDFEESLQGEDLFAITGPTGSGKSSIINSISLALYGKSYKSTLKSSDFVTTGQASASIKLLFNSHGEDYEASWSCKVLKKDGGAIKNSLPSRALSKNGKALDISTEQIIGLDFDQFCKCVILGQGQFSKFLTSTFSGRKEILEKLYNGEALSKLSTLLKTKLKTQKQELELLLANIQELNISEKTPSAIKKEVKESEKQLVAVSSSLTPFKELSTQALELSKLLHKSTESQKKLEDLNLGLQKTTKRYNQEKDNLQLNKESLEKIQLTHKEQTPKLQQLLIKENILKEVLQEKKKLETQYAKDQEAITTEKSRISESKIELEKLNKQITQYQQLPYSEKEIHSFEAQIIELERKDKKIGLIFNDYQNVSKSLTKIESHGKSLNLEVSKITDFIFNKYLKEDTAQINKELNQAIIEQQKKLEASIQISSSKEEKRKASSLLQEEIKKSQIKLEVLKSENKQSSEQLIQLKEKEEILKTKSENFKLKKAIKLCQEKLISEHSCPVCESVPADIKKIIESSHTPKDSLLMEQTQSELEDTSKKVAQAQIKQSNKELTLSNKDAELQKLKSEYEKITKELSSGPSSSTEKERELLKERQDEFNFFQKHQTQIINLNNRIQTSREEYKLEKKRFQELELNQTLEKKAFDKEIELLNKCLDSQLKLSELTEHLSQITRIFHLKNTLNLKIQAQEKLIKSSQLTLTENTAKAALLKEELVALNKRKENLTKELNTRNIQAEIDMLNEALEKEQISFKENEKSFNAITNELNISNNSKSHLSEHLNSLNNLMTSSLGNIKNLIRDHQFNFVNLTKLSELVADRHLPLKAHELEALHERILLPELMQLEQTQAQEGKKLSVLTERLRILQEQELKNKETKKKANLKKQQLLRLESLGLLISNDEFRNFALALIEEQLISLANVELQTLCEGRYRLFQVQNTRGHQDYYVKDNWSDDSSRKVSTLSGGETFLVSLSMALALSEMTRGQSEIDFFFIDEGFGSLDSESLDEALETLMSIRNRGKQLGIISHVTDLTSRIPINFNVIKDEFGHGKISMAYN